MAIGIVAWDANGQPIYGDLLPGQGDAPAGIGTTPTMQRPVNVPGSGISSASMASTYIPGTTTQRPVLMPYTNPQAIADKENAFNQWSNEQSAADTYQEEWQKGVLRDRQGAYTDWENNTQNQINKLPGIYQQQADARFGNTAGLRDMYEGLNSSDLAALGQYNQRANDLYNTTIPDYVAQQWTSNPQDIANQQQALGNFGDIYGGSLDYQAALATLTQAAYTTADYKEAQQTLARLYQYASDPSDVNRQKQALEQLHGLINGGEWADNLKEVRDKYKGLSDPEVTAQERFILEQFKQRREDLDRSNREAVMSNLAARGLRSGAAEQTAMLNSQQELGRQSVLTELGAEANAIARSQQAMQGWANTSAQGRQAELAAMGMYIDAAGQLRSMNDQVGMFNTQQANQNSMFNAGEANDISMFNANAYNQNQMFNANAYNQNQMFNAGQANQVSMYNAGQQNNAYANNQATRLAGAQGFADQSNAIRQSNDYVGTFNTGQANLVGMQNQRVAQDELIRKDNLANTQLGNITSVNSGIADRGNVIHDDQQSDIDSWANGLIAPVVTQIGFEDQKLQNKGTLADKTAAAGSDIYTGVFTPTINTRAAGRNALVDDKYRLG